MKRAAFVAMLVAVTASGWTFLAAQTPVVPQKTAPDPLPAPAAPPAATFPAPDLGTARVDGSALTPLQQRFVDLAKKKARLMSEEQLQQAVNELDRDVDELNAWTKVEESARALREVIEKHPQSRAAGTARSAIRIIEHGRMPNTAEEPFVAPQPGGPRADPGPAPADRPFGVGPGVRGPKAEPPTT